jgi:hypothetical protein
MIVDSIKGNSMTEEVKPEVAQPEPKPEATKPDTITVDIDGVSLDVPLETGKKLIEARQKAKKEVKDLIDKVGKSEALAKQEAERSALMKAMREQDVESVRSQVSQEYVGKINAYESKIFKGEVKSLLASNGVLPEALDDACSLALSNAKVALEGEQVTIDGKPAKDFLAEWVKSKQHLVAVKAPVKAAGKHSPAVPPKPQQSGKERMAQGLNKLFP